MFLSAARALARDIFVQTLPSITFSLKSEPNLKINLIKDQFNNSPFMLR